MIKVGDTVVRKVAGPYSLLPKGTVAVVAAVTLHLIVLKGYPQLALPLEDFIKVP